MPLNITLQQRDQIERIGGDAHVVQYEGVDAPGQPQYIPLSSDYKKMIDQSPNGLDNQPGTADDIDGNDVRNSNINGSKTLASSIVKNLSTHGASAHNNSPSYNFIGITTVSSVTTTFNSARRVLIIFNASCYTDISGTEVYYRVSVNGTDISPDLGMYISNPYIHHQIMGTWTADVPAGSVTIEGKLFRGSGTGSIILDGADITNLSVIG